MANLLINTTVGGNAVITTSNIGTYALTSLPSHNHDDRYYTEGESDGRYAYKAGAAGQDFSVDKLSSYYLRNHYSVSTNHSYGMYFDNDLSSAYGIYRESGSWDHPYPDLRIAFHTGIKLGANSSYQGIKFYTDYDMVTQVMSVNNGSDPLGGGNVYVNNSLQAGSSLRAPIFYDSANTNFYGDFASTSVVNAIRFGNSSNNGTLSAPSDWGVRVTTDAGYINFGPANSSYAHIYTDRGTFYFNRDLLVNGSTVWHAGNDGSGSGLDADLLDGQDQSYYFSKANIDASRNIGASTNLDTDLENGGSYGSYGAGGTSWNSPFSYGGVIAFAFTSGIKAQFGFDIRHTQSDYGDLWYRTKNNVGYSTWRTMWHSGNLTNLSQLTNGPGYLTGITSGQVTGALGYTPYNSSNPSGYITSSGSISGTAGSISGFNNPTTASTANTIVYRDASGDVAAREFVLTAATVHTVTPSSIVGIYPTTNQVVKFGDTAIKTFLGLGSLAYSSATIPTNNNQLTNGAGYITANDTTTGIFTTYLGNGTSNIGSGYTRVIRNENGTGGNPNYAPILHVAAGDTMWQIAGAHAGQTTFVWRSGYNGAWNTPWWTIYHSGNFTDNSSNWNTAFGWGNHASAGYQAASTAITTSNIGSQSVSNSNYINSTRDTPGSALQYWQAPSLGIDEAPSSDWHNTIRMGHGSPLSYYSNTLAIRMTGSGVGDIYTQTIMNGNRQGWKKHWNDGNDGSGSGLDADLLDGQEGSYYQPASTAITTSNIGSQSVSYATTSGALTSMNISQFTNNSGYITGYTETDTLNSVTGRGNTTSNSVRFGSHVDLSPTASAFRFYDGTTFRGGFGLDSWGHSGSDANLVLYVNGDNTLFFSTSGTKRASLSSTAFNSLVALQQSGNQVLHAGNYTSYSPSLTGSGASGTWGINITGNAEYIASNPNRTDGTAYPVVWSNGNSYSPNYSCAAVTIQSSTGTLRATNFISNQIVVSYANITDTTDGSTWYGLGNAGNLLGGGNTVQLAGWYGVRIKTSGANMDFYGSSVYYNATFNSAILQQAGNQVLHAGNYTSYSPSLTGSGASGTWSINVTGSAGSATTAINLIGLGSIQSTSTGTSYTANYQVRENSGGGSNTNEIYAPQLAFHWSGVVASSIMMESSGRMAIRNNPGGSYENFIAAVIYSSGYGDSTQWNTAYGWGNHASAGYQAASTAITTSNIGSQSVSYATTAGALTSMNISQFTNNSGYITGYTETDTLATVTARGATTASGITFTAAGGSVLLKHAVSEVDAWIFQENAANWGLYYKNNPSGHHTFGGYTTVGAETFGLSAANVSGNGVLTSNFVGATTAYAQWMLSNYTGYIWSASTIYAVGTMYSAAYRGNANVGGTGEASYHPAGIYSPGTTWLYGDMYKNNSPIYNLGYVSLTGGNTTPIEISGASHKYLTIAPGNGYEAMVRYIGGSGSSWYVGKRTTSQLVGTESFHFYSEAAGATVGGIDTSGNIFASGSMRAPIFYDSNDTGYYLDPNSNSVLNGVGTYKIWNHNLGSNYYFANGDWGFRHTTPSGWIQFGPANSSHAHIYTDRPNFYFNADLLVNGATVITSSSIGSQSVSYATTAGTANAVAWTNVSSRPTALSQFTNDLGNYGGWLTTSGKAADSELIDGIDSSRIIYGDGSFGSTNYSDMNNTAQKSGFFFYNQPTGNPFGDWTHWINCMGNSWNPNYGFQLAHAFHSNNFAVRVVANGGFSSWRTIIDSGNIGSQSVNYANSAGSAGSATNAGQLNTYGYLVGENWNDYYTSGKLRVASVAGSTSANYPSSVHNYGGLLSYGTSGEDSFQLYFPDNAANSISNSRKLHYRTGRNGGWSDWRTVVDMVGDTLTLVEGSTPKIVVRGSTGYGSPTSASIELAGDADNGQTKAYRWISTAPDWNGQDLKLERYSINNGYQLVGRVPKNTSNLEWQGTIVQGLSDSRVKTNVVSMTEGLDKIEQIRPVTFDWIPTENVSDREGADFGFIAQELEEVLPEVVHTRGDGYKTVMYEKVVPVLVQAMKEQQTMIEALRAEIELLKNR